MRKLICITLSLLFIFTLTACGGKSDPTEVVSGISTADESSESSEVIQAITLKEYSEPLDTVPKPVRDYFEQAKQYDTSKYDSTIVTNYLTSSQKPEPVNLGWKYSDNKLVNRSVVSVSLNKDMSDSFTTEISGNTNYLQVYNLYTGAEYYWQVEAFLTDGTNVKSEIGTFKTAEGIRLIYIDGVSNVRDIGTWETANGKKIKQGLVYRSAQMNSPGSVNITESGIDTALRQLGIKTDIDLRRLDEIIDGNQEPELSPLGNTVKYVHVSSTDYSNYFNSVISDSRVLRQFADLDNYPILFHCAVGADRTGTLALMLESLLGVNDENSLVMDYELTNQRDRTYGGFPAFMSKFKQTEGSTFQEKAYNFYYNRCKLSAMELSNIYNIMLTDSAVFKSDSLATQTVIRSGSVSFNLNLRSSGAVTGVTFNGQPVKYTFSDGRLTVNISGGSGLCQGEISFDDGESLKYDVQVNDQ
jgi:protein-tyrosine phosphatase